MEPPMHLHMRGGSIYPEQAPPVAGRVEGLPFDRLRVNAPNVKMQLWAHLVAIARSGTQVSGHTVQIQFFDAQVALDRFFSREDMQRKYPQGTFAKSLDFQATLQDTKLEGFWQTMEPNWKGQFDVRNNSLVTKYISDREMSWDEFKQWVSDNIRKDTRFLYRGQNCQKNLRSSFHRNNRCDLVRYMAVSRF